VCVLVTVNVRNVEPCSLDPANLRFHFALDLIRRNLLAYSRCRESSQTGAESRRIVGQSGTFFCKRFAIDQNDMAAGFQLWLRAGKLNRFLQSAGIRHHGSRCDNAAPVCQRNGTINSRGETEIICIDDQPAHKESLSEGWAAEHKWEVWDQAP